MAAIVEEVEQRFAEELHDKLEAEKKVISDRKGHLIEPFFS